MRVLFVYRNPKMGFSIGKVFKPIENEMRKYADVESIFLPCANYKPISLARNIRAARAAVKSKSYDVVHITGTEHYLLPFLKKYNTILTVHDLGFYTNKRKSLRTLGKNFLWIRSLKCAKRLTFISEKSRNEAIDLIHINKDAVCVIPNALDSTFKYSPKQINTSYPTILHIGSKPNKNLKNSVLALKDIPHHFRFIGKMNDEQKLLMQSHNINYSNAYNLTDEALIEEYRQCDIVNFPSLYEGFGMPILEAQAIGRPVVTSNIAPMNDIAGDGAILVVPTDINSITDGYKRVFDTWQTVVEHGLKNVQRFDIEHITRQYYELYQELTD